MAKAKTTEDQTPEVEQTPTPDEARALFADRPDLDSVLTTEGRLHRDGSLTPA